MQAKNKRQKDLMAQKQFSGLEPVCQAGKNSNFQTGNS